MGVGGGGGGAWISMYLHPKHPIIDIEEFRVYPIAVFLTNKRKDPSLPCRVVDDPNTIKRMYRIYNSLEIGQHGYILSYLYSLFTGLCYIEYPHGFRFSTCILCQLNIRLSLHNFSSLDSLAHVFLLTSYNIHQDVQSFAARTPET